MATFSARRWEASHAERQIEVHDHEVPVPAHDVRNLLRQYAVLLRECAADFLRGDPTVVHEVQGAVDKAQRKGQAPKKGRQS